MPDTIELRQLASKFRTDLRGMIRRVSIGVANASRLWQFLGYIGAEGERETFDEVELFQGIGFAARPKAGRGEAIVTNVGGSPGHAVATAMRDRASEPEDLDEDETQMHNTTAHVRVTKAGVVEVADRIGGTAVPLATLADLQALRTWIMTAMVLPVSGATAGPIPTPAAPTPAGTSKLKAQ